MEINRILPDEECEWKHFLLKNIIINGMHIITMKLLACFNIFSFFKSSSYLNLPYVNYPDEMNKLANDLDWKKDVSGWSFYYDSKITKDVFFYLKDDLLSGIQGIDAAFDLKGFKFNHKTHGYPLSTLLMNFENMPAPILDEVINRIKNNLDKIYKKIYVGLSKIEEVLKSIPNDDSQKPFDNFDDAYFCDLFFHNFLASKNIENYLSEISDYFTSNISYLGPLREDPKPLYPMSEVSYTYDIGKKGENTATILAIYGKTPNVFPCPNLDNSGIYKNEKKTLKKAVIEWLKYIGVLEDIEANMEQGGFTLKIKTSSDGGFSDLTNVGVGVSQVVPIVTMCLLAAKGTTLIIEQPELHLHPKMQTKLTDFFVAISQSGKQCIIETHSEHIINALRYRVAKTAKPADEELAKNIQIYFVEKDKEGALFRSININKYAAISDWPEGFFDESSKAADEIIKAVSKKWEENKDDKR